MAVAAYASLVSLTHVLDNIHYRAEHQCPRLDINLIETLQEKVNFLLDFVEAHSLRTWGETEAPWRKMAEVAFEAEDFIDFHVVNELCRQVSQEGIHAAGYTTFNQDIQNVIEVFECIKKEIWADRQYEDEGEDAGARLQPTLSISPSGSLATVSGGKSIMVGFDEHVVKILDGLTNTTSNLQIFPIIGVGGIGKTTLAKHIFEHPSTNCRFDMCIWVTISQEYSIQRILRDLLGEQESKDNYKSVAQLRERLHKKLFGNRYLIVLDDVWTTEVWDALQMSFPNNNNGSKIMMTTRLLNVAEYVSGFDSTYSINFLSDDESWSLLCHKVFAQDECPDIELEEIGRDIAKSCRGLPLLISVIGGLLAKSDMTKEDWEFIAQNVSTLGNLEDDEYCLRSLYLSYVNLPISLKSCFLYMRVYPEDADIDISELINLWVVEGFIKSNGDKSLEEIAEEHLKNLIDRNLIFIRTDAVEKKRQFCGIHDLLRDLCARESTKECFIYSPKAQRREFYMGILAKTYPRHWFCLLCSQFTGEKPPYAHEIVHFSPSTLETRFLLCNACEKMYSPHTRLKPLRVMKDDSSDLFQLSGLQFVCLENVRCLKFSSLSSLHLLWNLQILKVSIYFDFPQSPLVLPSQIWKMPQVRHLDIYNFILPDPDITLEGSDFIILKNLHTLSTIYKFKCPKDFSRRIPNIKKLKISKLTSPCDLTQFRKLESLSISRWESYLAIPLSVYLAIPNSLKKLQLVNCGILPEDMKILGSLPNLEVLKLNLNGNGFEWNSVDGEFCRLKVLLVRKFVVKYLRVEPNCFSMLESLILVKVNFEIPLDIGCKDTLRLIRLVCCGKSVIESARKIWEEHLNMGNQNLQVHVDSKQVDVSTLEEPDTVDVILDQARKNNSVIRISL